MEVPFISPHTLRLILIQSGLLLRTLLPFIVAGCVVSAGLKQYLRKAGITRMRGIKGPFAVPAAALAGALSPVCTLGSLPIIITLIQAGLPWQAALAFLSASSIITPQMTLLIIGNLGIGIAFYQIILGLFLAILFGYSLQVIAGKGAMRLSNEFREPAGCYQSQKSFFTHFLDQLEFVSLPLLFGIFLSQVISLLFPEGIAPAINGSKLFPAAFIASLCSGPFYTCGGAAIPVAGVLKTKGISQGLITTILISGPATRIRSFTAIAKIIKLKGIVIYALYVICFSAFSGYLIGILAD